MLKRWYWKFYERIGNMIGRFEIKRGMIPDRRYHVGDIYLDKKTKKTWRIIYTCQDLLGDYDIFIRDEKGRVRAIKDFNLDDGIFFSKTKKLIRCVEKNEDELDLETMEKIEAYFEEKRQKLIKANYDNAIITASGTLLSRHRLKSCLKCGSKNVAEYLYGDDFDEEWLENHLEKGDFLLADENKVPEKHVFHCKECGEDYNPFAR